MTEPQAAPRVSGMRAFLVVWVGQLVSLIGSAMTGFALPIYIFGETERVRELALLGLAFMLPLIVFSPMAGAIVDRSNRKLMMMLSDIAAGLTTIVVLVLVSTGRLEIWHLYITNAINGAFQTLQWPAYSAAISLMIPKEQYGRANGLMSLAESGSGIFAPLLAGSVLGILGREIGLRAILLTDIITFVAAVGALLWVHVPQPRQTAEGAAGQGSLLRESAYGFQYILARPSLLGLQLVFMFGNFVAVVAFTTMAAMVLYRTGQDAQIYGYVASVGAAGGIAGSLVMSAWGGPKRRAYGVVFGWVLSGLLGMTLMGLGRYWPVWALAAFLGQFLVPIINGSNQALWQAKVAPDVQGRVFSVRRLIAWGINPLAQLAAIPLADAWLEPAMRAGGSLQATFGWLVGTGPGAGTALIFVFGGILAALIGLGGFFVPAIREADIRLPDHEQDLRADDGAAVPAGSTPVPAAPAPAD